MDRFEEKSDIFLKRDILFLLCGEKNGNVKHKIREIRGQFEGFKVIHKKDDGMVPGESLMWFIYYLERNYPETW